MKQYTELAPSFLVGMWSGLSMWTNSSMPCTLVAMISLKDPLSYWKVSLEREDGSTTLYCKGSTVEQHNVPTEGDDVRDEYSGQVMSAASSSVY